MFLNWRKSQARKAAQKRRLMAHRDGGDAAHALVANFPDELWPAIGSVVSGYRAIGTEIDPSALLETFHCEQVRLALPRVVGRGQPLDFRVWAPGEPLEKGQLGVEEPSEEADRARPTLVLVPALAIDRRGHRLGYGAGYYDRTLAALRKAGPVTSVGLCYEDQRVRSVPSGRHDVSVDWIVTEKAAYRAGK